MRLLFDTTLLIDVLRQRRAALELFEKLAMEAEEMATSVVAMAEVYAGQRAGEEFITAKLFAQLNIYPLTPAIAKRGGLLKNMHARKGNTVLLDDMLIAATALEHHLTLHTFNRKDFKNTGVNFYGGEES